MGRAVLCEAHCLAVTLRSSAIRIPPDGTRSEGRSRTAAHSVSNVVNEFVAGRLSRSTVRPRTYGKVPVYEPRATRALPGGRAAGGAGALRLSNACASERYESR